jgi:hypothetical protein
VGESSALARRRADRPDDDEGVTHRQVRPDPALGLLKPTGSGDCDGPVPGGGAGESFGWGAGLSN